MRDLVEMEAPTTGVLLSQENVTAKNRRDSYGPGRLFVTEECVCWISQEHKGFVLSYLEISLHAISKDPASFPEECIYVLLDTSKSDSDSDEDMEENGLATNGDGENDAAIDRELCFVPEDKSSLEAIFSAMARGQALHPDPADVDSNDEAEDVEGTPEDEGAAGNLGSGDLDINGAEQDEQFDSEEDEDGDHEGAPPNHQHMGGGDA